MKDSIATAFMNGCTVVGALASADYLIEKYVGKLINPEPNICQAEKKEIKSFIESKEYQEIQNSLSQSKYYAADALEFINTIEPNDMIAPLAIEELLNELSASILIMDFDDMKLGDPSILNECHVAKDKTNKNLQGMSSDLEDDEIIEFMAFCLGLSLNTNYINITKRSS